MGVVLEFPGGGVGEVWVIDVLPSALQPSDGLHLLVSEEEGGLEAEVLRDQHEDAQVEPKPESPVDFHHLFSFLYLI